MANVTVYTSPSCPWCHKLKDFLKEHKVKFTEKDVASDVKIAEEAVEKSGQRGVPITDIDGEIIVGFDEVKLKKLLKLR